MKWAEGIDKLDIFLYLAISLFAIANIYSVDEIATRVELILENIPIIKSDEEDAHDAR